LHFAVTKAAKLIPQITYLEAHAYIKQIAVRIDLGWETPFLALKFFRDGSFQALEVPAPKNQTARGNEEKGD